MLDGCFIIKSFSLSLSLSLSLSSLSLSLSLSLSSPLSLSLFRSLSLKLSQNGSLKRNTSTLSQLQRSHNVSPTRSLTHALSSTLTPPVLRALKTAFSSAYGTPRIPLSSACGTLCILQCVPLFTTVCTSSLLQCVQLFIARTRPSRPCDNRRARAAEAFRIPPACRPYSEKFDKSVSVGNLAQPPVLTGRACARGPASQPRLLRVAACRAAGVLWRPSATR